MAKEVSTYQSHRQEGILLNANESWESLDMETMVEIQKRLPEVAINRYPVDDDEELLDVYSKRIGVNPACIMAGNGSDALLGLMIGFFLGKGKTLYTFAPDFSMYDYYASSYEAKMEKYICQEDGSVDVQDFIAQGKEKEVDAIVFSNPNNPTGHCLNKEEVLTIVRAFPDIPVIVDEAYMEFGNQSVKEELDACPNLYITRTLSKAYAMAGIRVGFVL
ncbi:MAG: histidinol-phosphate aminotransferase family protein, partial [Erysipelotrichaceae bacterium]|nr:histidinol-phosphate aminotransferase family protein [Erysipelotrichaceae bacterium]